MSWAESEKLNEWIHRAYDNGKQEEQERIIKLLENMQKVALITKTDEGKTTAWALENAVALIKGENK